MDAVIISIFESEVYCYFNCANYSLKPILEICETAAQEETINLVRTSKLKLWKSKNPPPMDEVLKNTQLQRPQVLQSQYIKTHYPKIADVVVTTNGTLLGIEVEQSESSTTSIIKIVDLDANKVISSKKVDNTFFGLPQFLDSDILCVQLGTYGRIIQTYWVSTMKELSHYQLSRTNYRHVCLRKQIFRKTGLILVHDDNRKDYVFLNKRLQVVDYFFSGSAQSKTIRKIDEEGRVFWVEENPLTQKYSIFVVDPFTKKFYQQPYPMIFESKPQSVVRLGEGKYFIEYQKNLIIFDRRNGAYKIDIHSWFAAPQDRRIFCSDEAVVAVNIVGSRHLVVILNLKELKICGKQLALDTPEWMDFSIHEKNGRITIAGLNYADKSTTLVTVEKSRMEMFIHLLVGTRLFRLDNSQLQTVLQMISHDSDSQ